MPRTTRPGTTGSPTDRSPAPAELFADPPHDFGPTPLWWWSAEKVTEERLDWQLRRFADGGVHNLVVINLAPAGPTYGARPDDPAWFSEEWWRLFSHACATAAECGVKLWIYDQIGFSGANVQGRVTLDHRDATGLRLRHRTDVVADRRVALRGAERLVAGYLDGSRVHTAADGTVDAPRGARVDLVVATPTAFDYLDPGAVDLLLDTVHREYERRVPQYLGTVIPGSFQDELPNTNAWTDRFAEEFRRRRGYDLLDHGLVLFADAAGFATDAAAKVRTDYYAVRAELAEEAFFVPLARWHAEHGLLIGADQTNPARAGYPTQSTQIYTDYPRTHRWYSAVGSDHEGDSKIHSSLAHLYGHPRVWIESFHSSGWGGTLEDTYDWLLPFLRSGANLYNPHASYYSTVAGWFEWAPPSTDWRQPYWPHYRRFADAVARICSIMSWGDYQADVAVLHPTTTAQAGLGLDLGIAYFGEEIGSPHDVVDRAQRTYLELCGTNNWFSWRPSALDAARIAFDIIDDDSVHRSTVDTGRAVVARQAYRTVILPAVDVIEEATARRLSDLLDAGGRVIAVGVAPRIAAGRNGDDDAVTALARHPRLELVDSVAAAVARLDQDEQHVVGDVPLLVRAGRDEHGPLGVALVTGAHPNASRHPLRRPGQRRWTDYDFDRNRYAGQRVITIAARVTEAAAWNPATGERRAVAVGVRSDGRSEITVPQQGAPAWILVWREGEAAAGRPALADQPVVDQILVDHTSADHTSADQTPAVIAGPWTGRLVPTMDNTWGDLARPAGRELTEPEIWQLTALRGEEWVATRATFGSTVLVGADAAPLDPAAAEEVLAGGRPLADEHWQRYEYSASRGSHRDPIGSLGTKGLVPSEFVLCEPPEPGHTVSIRALVGTERRGAAELLVFSSAAKRVRWNGIELTAPDGYLGRYPITIDRPVNLLEYELGPSRAPGLTGLPLGSGFALAAPGGYTDRPEYMRIDADDAIVGGTIIFERSFTLTAPADDATLVVGAARAATVIIDDTIVGRQERVEYYDSDARTEPQFFSHDVTALLTAGEHRIEIRLDSADPAEVVYADLVARTRSGPCVLVSGAGWSCRAGDRTAASMISPGQWHPMESAYATLRPHPLPRAHWLRGDPPVGEASFDLLVGDDATPARRAVRALLPSGATRVRIAARVPVRARIGGFDLPVVDGVFDLPEPLRRPAELELATEPIALLPGASFLDGPLTVECVEAPIVLGEWRDVGLGDWSGAVRYATTLTPPAGRDWTLDLGELRGSVSIAIDGRLVAEAFCAPFRFTLPAVDRPVRLEITVHNTLGPYLQATTPTTWVFDSQLSSGLFGPVTAS